MNKDNVKQMFAKIQKDANFQKNYVELMRKHQLENEKALADKLIEFGKSSGFAFSKDDLQAARAELIDKVNENKELGDNDLANVAGGGNNKNNAIAKSVYSFGIVCAINSLVEWNKCASWMTTSDQNCKNT